MKPGQTVVIMGSGIAGLLQIQLARVMGAGRIIATDIVDFRLEAARKFGADIVIDAREDIPARLRELNRGRLADLIVVCTGAVQAFQQALRSIDRGGTVLVFAPTAPGVAVPLPINDLWPNEITIKTCYGGSPEDAEVAYELICGHRLNLRDMITHRLSIDEIGLGFRLVAEARDSIKVIIEPQR